MNMYEGVCFKQVLGVVCCLQVTLRDERKQVIKKKQFELQMPLTIRGLQDQVCDVLTIPRSWDFQFYFGDDEDRHITWCSCFGHT